MTDLRIEKWLRWLPNIEADVERMHLHRMVFVRLDEIVRANPQLPPSYFFEYLSETYASTQAVAVRRQAEATDDVQTLGRLIFELEESANLVTRDWWIGLWENDDGVRFGIADGQWNDYFAGDVGDYLDPAIPRRDRATLVEQRARSSATLTSSSRTPTASRGSSRHRRSTNSTRRSTCSAIC